MLHGMYLRFNKNEELDGRTKVMLEEIVFTRCNCLYLMLDKLFGCHNFPRHIRKHQYRVALSSYMHTSLSNIPSFNHIFSNVSTASGAGGKSIICGMRCPIMSNIYPLLTGVMSINCVVACIQIYDW